MEELCQATFRTHDAGRQRSGDIRRNLLLLQECQQRGLISISSREREALYDVTTVDGWLKVRDTYVVVFIVVHKDFVDSNEWYRIKYDLVSLEVLEHVPAIA